MADTKRFAANWSWRAALGQRLKSPTLHRTSSRRIAGFRATTFGKCWGGLITGGFKGVKSMGRVLLSTALMVFFISGCATVGPTTIPRDRFDYNSAISDSWKEQTLLNIVKIRYADMPLFVEVASVVSGYTVEGSVNLNGTQSSDDAVQGDFFSFGTTGKYTDRPTITYAPITGQQFNKSFMTPIPPKAIMFLLQSGWSAELILPITVDSLNGLRARRAGGPDQRAGDPKFYRAIELLRKVQKSGAVGMQILKGDDQKETTVLFFHRQHLSADLEATLRELDELLGLDPDSQEFSITYGILPKSDKEIALLTRSILQIMIALATEVEVPPEHVAEGRTIPALERGDETTPERGRLIDIQYSPDKPENAFTAVKYRDHWFWIDDRDFQSKRTFAFLMILFSLTETGGREGLPLVTIPTG